MNSILRIALCGGLVITFGAGCSSVLKTVGLQSDPTPPQTQQYAEAAEPAPVAPAPASPFDARANAAASLLPAADETPAPVINVFGDVNGQEVAAKFAADPGAQQHTGCEEGHDADVAIDPAGQWLVFASTRHSERSHLYLQKKDGRAVTELTSGDFDDAHPIFSPDGKHVAFASTRGGRWSIYTVDLDGRNLTQVTNGAGQDLHPSFSPDGSRLVYCSLAPRGDQWELWVVDLSTGQKRAIGSGLFPAWCPDKTVDRIAFQRARQRGTRSFGIWTLDLVDGEARRLTEVASSASAALISPAWSQDGKQIAFSAVLNAASAQGERPTARQELWVVNADGTSKQRLTTGAGANLSPVWAADNRVYFISDRAGRENVWSIKPQTTGAMLAEKKQDKKAETAVGSADTKANDE